MLLLKRFCSNYQRINTIASTKKCGDKLGVQGFIQNARRLKNNIFLDVCDGSTGKKFQIVVPKSAAHIKELTVGSSIRAVGCVQTAPNGNFELHAEDVNVIVDGNFKSGYPFTAKQAHSPEYVREHLHLRTRVDNVAAVMRLRHRAQKCIHDYMDAAGFVHVNAPILSTNDCEGAGEVFTVRPDSAELLKEMSRPHDPLPLDECYFDAKVFLTVSSQLHLEAMCYGLGNTYTLAPAFRAENCRSPLHLAEFYMLEAELAFTEDLSILTAFIEHMIRTVTGNVLAANTDDLNLLAKHANDEQKCDWQWLECDKWPTLSYDEAANIIMQHKSKFKTAIKLGEGFSKEQELFLVEYCKAPVFVVDWPAKQKPFYMKVKRENPNYVHALDLLMPTVGELCGGSLREYDEQRLREHAELPAGLEWYLELRKYGGLPTGGFGMGFERYLQLLSGVKNIRDVIPFPRYPHTCKM